MQLCENFSSELNLYLETSVLFSLKQFGFAVYGYVRSVQMTVKLIETYYVDVFNEMKLNYYPQIEETKCVMEEKVKKVKGIFAEEKTVE